MATRTQSRDQLRNQASQVADTVTTTATQATDSIKDTLREQADARLDGIAQQVNTVGEVLHETAQHLRERQQSLLAGQTDHLASRAETVSRHLQSTSAEGLLREAEDYARARPGMVLGAAVIAGFAAARLLKVGGSRAMATQAAETSPRVDPIRQTGAGAPPPPVRRAS